MYENIKIYQENTYRLHGEKELRRYNLKYLIKENKWRNEENEEKLEMCT